MKTKVLSALFFVMIGGLAMAQSGGPDTYGYTWKSNAAAGGPVYNWKNIKGIGTQVTGLTDDNSVGTFNMNWSFKYYWNNYNKVLIGSNGWLSFTTLGNIAAPMPTIPTATAPNNYIAPMLSDLTFTASNNSAVPGASCWYWTNNVDSFIVQWDSVPFWVNNAAGWAGRNSFQVILTGDSTITFQYKLQQQGTPAYDMAGEHMTTGIENSTGAIGLQVSRDVYPTANTAVKFYYPNPVTYQVFDANPAWNHDSTNGGFFVAGPYGSPKTMKAAIHNSGNQNLTNLSLAGTIYDASLAQVWTSSKSVASLAPNVDSVVTFSTPYYANTIGPFIYRTTSTVTGDMNAGNNMNDVEMMVVDTSMSSVPLAFSVATTFVGGLGWQGGNGGGGVYFAPPFYPATATAAEFMIATNDSAKGFSSVVFDDNGTNGGPGTVLDSTFVAPGSVIVGSYNTVTFPSPITITSGGVYVGWYMGGNGLNLGTDDALPLSFQNYEIIGGSWAPYRNNSAEDLMIRLVIQGSNTTGAGDLAVSQLSVSQNYPNPANAYTMFNFVTPSNNEVELTITNMVGQQVDAINFGTQTAGDHTVRINTSKFQNGIYFYTVKCGDQEVTKKMIVSH